MKRTAQFVLWWGRLAFDKPIVMSGLSFDLGKGDSLLDLLDSFNFVADLGPEESMHGASVHFRCRLSTRQIKFMESRIRLGCQALTLSPRKLPFSSWMPRTKITIIK